MVSCNFIAVLGALPLALAQSSSTSSAIATTTGTASKQTVAVGKDGLKFTPDTIQANVGDQITFEFFPKNHSVVQADFDNPCNPSASGLFSGFIASSSGKADTTFTITVNDTEPIWLYCAALQPSPHCAAGMVAVINAPDNDDDTLDAFREAANQTTTRAAPDTVRGGKLETSSNGTSPNVTTGGSPSPTGATSSLIVNIGIVVGVALIFDVL